MRGGQIDGRVAASGIRCQLDLRRRPGDGLLYSRPGNGGDAHQGGVTDTLLLFVLAVVSLALAGLILAAFVSLRDGHALRKHYKKLANLVSFMDKIRYASWSGMPVVATALYKTLQARVLLATTMGQDGCGRCRGVPDRGRRRRRAGEDADRGGEAQAWSGAASAGRERLDLFLGGFQAARLDCVHRDRRETRGESGPR